MLADAEGPVVVVPDWAKALPGQIARWMPGKYTSPGTDGWGLLRHRAGKIPRPARPVDRQVPAGPPGQRSARLNPGKPLQDLSWDGLILPDVSLQIRSG